MKRSFLAQSVQTLFFSMLMRHINHFAFEIIKTEAKKKILFDISEKDYDFAKVEEAQEYAQKNIGALITRLPSKEGYIIKFKNHSYNE